MIKLRCLVKKFFKKALRGDSRPGYARRNALLNRCQDLVLPNSIKLGKIAA